MPKMKSKKSATKRFKKTATGKIKRRHAFKTHILSKMTPKRIRQLRKATMVSKADEKNVKRMLQD